MSRFNPFKGGPFLNVHDFGAYGDGTTDVTAQLQSAVNAASGKTALYVPAGHYMFRGLTIPSYTTIIFDPNATMELISGCNKYFTTNTDYTNGNKNIKIMGGTWIGNGSSMTRTFGATLAASYYGFGHFFANVDQIEIGEMQIQKTNAWSVAHNQISHFHIHDIYFQQDNTTPGGNGDGVTGTASNHGIIENITGYTNDDMIALGASTPEITGTVIKFVLGNVSDVIIRGIRPESSSRNAVALYADSGYTVSSVVVSDVIGTCGYAAVLFDNYYGGTGYMQNVRVSNVQAVGASSSYGLITINNISSTGIIIDGVSKTQDTVAMPGILVQGSSQIDMIDLSNFSFGGSSTYNQPVILDEGNVISVFTTNIKSIVSGGGTQPFTLYQKNSTTVNTTNVYGSAIHANRQTTASMITVTQGKVRVNSSEITCDRTTLTPAKWDKCLDINNGLSQYNGTTWTTVQTA